MGEGGPEYEVLIIDNQALIQLQSHFVGQIDHFFLQADQFLLMLYPCLCHKLKHLNDKHLDQFGCHISKIAILLLPLY